LKAKLPQKLQEVPSLAQESTDVQGFVNFNNIN